MIVRRFGRNANFTPFLTESRWRKRDGVALQGRETVLVKAVYGNDIEETREINEISSYGDRIGTAVEGSATFSVKVSELQSLKTATLRIGISRPPDAGHELSVTFNGKQLHVPLEECAERLVEKEYASCKLIPVDPTDVNEINTVTVSFPDGKPGAVGAVVIRAGVQVSPAL
jgi:hypothetical protein